MAKFFLTQRAFSDLLEIETYSKERWGENQTDSYMNAIYVAFKKTAEKPHIGELRQYRSFPFYMAPAERHYAVYKVIDHGIIIATVLHGHRNIESIIQKVGNLLADEIDRMERKI